MKNFCVKKTKKGLNLQPFKAKQTIMKNLLKPFQSFLLVILILASAKDSQASHIMGADISYKLINETTGRYRFRVTLYRDCAGIQFGGEQLVINNNGTRTTIPLIKISDSEVTPICLPPDVVTKPPTNCPSGPVLANGIKGVFRWIYEAEFTIGYGANTWAYAGWTSCCRNNIINTIASPGGAGVWVQAVINRDPAIKNNSTIFTSPPIPYWCRQRLNTYNHGSVDFYDDSLGLGYININVNGVPKAIKRDSLSFVLYTPHTGEAATMTDALNLNNPAVTFNAGLSRTNFLYTTGGVTMNPLTGSISCIPSISQDAIMAIAVIEWRAVPNATNTAFSRRMAGYVCRDIQFTVRDICDPIFTPGVVDDSLRSANYVSFDKVDICGSKFTQITFKVLGAPFQFLKYKIIDTPSSMAVRNFKYKISIQRVNNTDTLFGTLTFDSTIGVGSERFTLEAYYCSSIGTKVSQFYSLLINFRPSVTVNKASGYYCLGGKPLRVTARGGDTYSWKPKTNIVKVSGPDSSWIEVAPLVTTTYVAQALSGDDLTKSCSIYDSIKVIVIPRFSYSLSPKVLNLCLQDTFKINLSTQISDTPYIYKWIDPTIGSLFDPSNKRTTTISSPKGIALSDAKYYIDMTSRFDCELRDSVQVNIVGMIPNANAISARKLVCPGDTTLLSVRVTPARCGLSLFNSSAVSGTVTALNAVTGVFPVGAAACPALVVPNNAYPNPYTTVGGGRSSINRYIYTVADLTAAGLRPGIIKSLAFNITNLCINSLSSFEIRMACIGTSQDAVNSNPMTQTVYGPQAISCASGWNTYTFARGYDWDGKSNILIEVYADNATTTTTSNTIQVNALPSFSNAAYKYSNSAGVSATNAAGGFSAAGATAARPVIRMTYTGVDSTSPLPFMTNLWAPSNIINLPPYAAPSAPQGIAKITQKDSVFIATMGTAQCFDTAKVVVKIDTNFSVKAAGGRVICIGTGPNPTVNLTSTLKGGPTFIEWSSIPAGAGAGLPANVNTQNITVNPSVGTWKYVINTSNPPCSASDTVIVVVNPNLPVSFIIDSSLCTSATGKIKAILPAGTNMSQYRFDWSTAVMPNPIVALDTTRDSIRNLGNGDYNLTITLKSDRTCTGSTSGTVFPKTVVLNTVISSTGIDCFGNTADSITATVNTPASPGPYAYLWTGGLSPIQSPKNVAIGTYTVTATDNITGCTGNATFNQTQPTKLNVVMAGTDPLCNGEANGSMSATVTGGTPNPGSGSYFFTWTRNGATISVPGGALVGIAAAGKYKVTVTDNNGCVVIDSVTLVDPAPFVIDSLSVTNATFVNGTDGIVRAFVSGGTGPFTYKWAENASTITPRTNKPASDTLNGCRKARYCVTVVDSKGCEAIQCIQVLDIVCKWVFQVKADTIACFGSSNGRLAVRAIDSFNYPTTTWYNYDLYAGAISTPVIDQIVNAPQIYPTDTAFYGLNATNVYNIRIRTNKGCDTFIGPFQIEQRPPMTVNVNTQMPSCLGFTDGQATAIVSDAFSPFSFEWNNDGNYVSSLSFVNDRPAGKAQFVRTRNSLGCIVSTFYDVDTPKGIQIQPVLTDSATCFGFADGKGRIDVTPATPATGSYIYKFKPGTNVDTTSNQITNVAAGTYNIRVEYVNVGNGRKCFIDSPFTMAHPDVLTLTSVNTDLTCSYTGDGSIVGTTLGGNGGNQFELVSPISAKNRILQTSNTFSNLDTSAYTLRVVDRKGCVATVLAPISKPDSFRITFGLPTPATCIMVSNGVLNINQHIGGNSGSYTYNWTRTDQPTGTTSSWPHNTSNPLPLINLTGLGTYNVTVTDSKGCITTGSQFVDTVYVLRVASIQTDSANCFASTDGKMTITSITPSIATGPMQYAFSGGTHGGVLDNFITAAAGTYQVTVTDAVGCIAQSQETILEPEDIRYEQTMLPARCFGEASGAIQLTNVRGGNGGYTYQWNTTPQQFSDNVTALEGGSYTVTVTDRKNCVKSQTFQVTQPDTFRAWIGTQKNITCFAANDGELKVSLRGGAPSFNYTWNQSTLNNPNLSGLKPGNYRVTVTDITGCTTSATAEILEPKKLEFQTIKVDSVSCPRYSDGAIDVSIQGGTITAQKQYEFSIDGGSTYVSGNKFTNLTAKNYNVIVRDNNNCVAARLVTVGSPEELFVTAFKDNTIDTIKMGEQTRIDFTPATQSGIIPAYQNILWSPSNGLSCTDCKSPNASPYITTIYDLDVRYHKNCIAKSTIKVPVHLPVDFFVPSAFTPANGDYLNDTLLVYGVGIKKVLFMVFNRWGEKVFESHHLSMGWDGKFKGDMQTAGVYTFRAEVEYLNGEKRTKQGSVTLIR